MEESLGSPMELIDNTGTWEGNEGDLFRRESLSGCGVDQIGLLRGIPPHDILIGGILNRGK